MYAAPPALETDGVLPTLAIDDAEPARAAPDPELQAAGRLAQRQVREAEPGAMLSPLRPETVGGAPGLRFDGAVGETRFTQVLAVRDGRVFTLTLTAARRDFARRLGVLDGVLRSWRWA